MSRRAVWLALIGAGLLSSCGEGTIDSVFDEVELRVVGLADAAVWIHLDVTSAAGKSTLEPAIDDTIGRTIPLNVADGAIVSLEATALDGNRHVLQHGRIASARGMLDSKVIWRVTLVDAGANSVVCDGLDNDGNGSIDEDGCAE